MYVFQWHEVFVLQLFIKKTDAFKNDGDSLDHSLINACVSMETAIALLTKQAGFGART